MDSPNQGHESSFQQPNNHNQTVSVSDTDINIDTLESQEHQEWVSGLEILKDFPCNSHYSESSTSTDADYELMDLPDDFSTVMRDPEAVQDPLSYHDRSHTVISQISWSSIDESSNNMARNSSSSDVNTGFQRACSFSAYPVGNENQFHSLDQSQHSHQQHPLLQPHQHFTRNHYHNNTRYTPPSNVRNRSVLQLYPPPFVQISDEANNSSGHTSSASSPSPFNEYMYQQPPPQIHSSIPSRRSSSQLHHFNRMQRKSAEYHYQQRPMVYRSEASQQRRHSFNRLEEAVHFYPQHQFAYMNQQDSYDKYPHSDNHFTTTSMDRRRGTIIQPISQKTKEKKRLVPRNERKVSEDRQCHQDNFEGTGADGEEINYSSDSEQEDEGEDDENNNADQDNDDDDDVPKPRRKASNDARRILLTWLVLHQNNPYPNRKQKQELATATGMTLKQIVHWMSNIRKRRFMPLLSGKREATSKVDIKFLDEIEEIKRETYDYDLYV